jgi:hypothetical protein
MTVPWEIIIELQYLTIITLVVMLPLISGSSVIVLRRNPEGQNLFRILEAAVIAGMLFVIGIPVLWESIIHPDLVMDILSYVIGPRGPAWIVSGPPFIIFFLIFLEVAHRQEVKRNRGDLPTTTPERRGDIKFKTLLRENPYAKRSLIGLLIFLPFVTLFVYVVYPSYFIEYLVFGVPMWLIFFVLATLYWFFMLHSKTVNK